MNATNVFNATQPPLEQAKAAAAYVATDAIPHLVDFAQHLIAALVVLFAGIWLARRLGRFAGKAVGRRGDAELAKFVRGLVCYTLMAAVVVASLGELGIRTTSLLTIFGTAGLAVGLALKNYLSNFAAGVMLLMFRPFRSGHKVNAGGVTGKVQEISVFDTHVVTPDNQLIIIPNSKIVGNTITNYSAKDTRKCTLTLAFSPATDMEALRAILLESATDNAMAVSDPEPRVRVADIAGGKLSVALECWSLTENLSTLESELREDVLSRLNKAGMTTL